MKHEIAERERAAEAAWLQTDVRARLRAAHTEAAPVRADVERLRRWHFAARRYDEAARIASLAAPYLHPRLFCSTARSNETPRI